MERAPRFVFRCDAGPGSGAGHFMRQLAVAQRAVKHGAATMLVPAQGEPLLAQLAPAIEGLLLPGLAPMEEAAWIRARFGSEAHVFVDSYQLPIEYYAAFGARCIAFEDGERDLPAGLVVKPRPRLRPCKDPRVLEGTEYIPVREAFTAAPAATRSGGHLVICFGASDPTGGTAEVLARLPAEPPPGWRVTVVRGPLHREVALPSLPRWHVEVVVSPDMPTLLGSADAAIVAAGSIVWELAVLGVPTMAFSVVDNQDRNANWLRETGCIAGGWRLGSQPLTEHTDVSTFLADAAWRETLSEALHEQIDGLGAERIVAAALAHPTGVPT